jgi:hypothetical protein
MLAAESTADNNGTRRRCAARLRELRVDLGTEELGRSAHAPLSLPLSSARHEARTLSDTALAVRDAGVWSEMRSPCISRLSHVDFCLPVRRAVSETHRTSQLRHLTNECTANVRSTAARRFNSPAWISRVSFSCVLTAPREPWRKNAANHRVEPSA